MTQPEDHQDDDRNEHVAPEHDHPDGAVMGWSASDFGRADYVGDEQTDGLPLLADGTQDDGPVTVAAAARLGADGA